MGTSADNNEQKVCGFLNLATGVSHNPDCLEACHPLPSEGKNKIIVKFWKRKDVDLVNEKQA